LKFTTSQKGLNLDEIAVWIYVVKVQLFQTDAESFGLLLQNRNDFVLLGNFSYLQASELD